MLTLLIYISFDGAFDNSLISFSYLSDNFFTSSVCSTEVNGLDNDKPNEFVFTWAFLEYFLGLVKAPASFFTDSGVDIFTFDIFL